MKVKGGILFYALAVSIVIGLLMSAVILAGGCHRLLMDSDRTTEELVRNAESGIYYLCATPGDGITLTDLFGRGKDSVRLEREQWGAYDVAVSTAIRGNREETRIAMLGTLPGEKYALWLADMDRPLGLCGAAVLNGNCFLPASGVERMYIEGQSFLGTQLVHGVIQTSSRFIPACNQQRTTAFQQLFHTSEREDILLEDWNARAGNEEHSFSDPMFVLYSNDVISIGNDSLQGHILVQSAREIRVEQEAMLDNIILVAPRVVIEDHVEGRFQVFARDSIVIGRSVQMKYPSVAVILPSPGAVDHRGIRVGENSKIAGELFLDCKNDDTDLNEGIAVEPDAEITGDVYCNGTLQLKGTVIGSVTAQKVKLVTNSASYDNCLLGAKIDRDALNPEWLGSCLTSTQTVCNVLQWLR